MKKHLLCFLCLATLALSGCFLNKKNTENGSDGKPTSGTVNIQIYASNDIHGQVKETSEIPGLGKYATYFMNKRKEPNTLLLDQGDAWQGSIYSNRNHGQLITDVMNYVHYDARCIGNHDFDWGVSYIKSNNARSYKGYCAPALAGNVYDYDFVHKTVGTTQQSEIGVKSTIVTVNDNIKVGILGGIGQDQITSINSLYVQDIYFKEHISFIKEEANRLRNEEKCDVIICSIHAGQEQVMDNGLDKYVDLVLCGHTHRRETGKEGNLYYVQNSGYEGSFSHITLTYDYAKKDVTKTKVSYIYGQDIKQAVSTIDSGIQSLLDEYNCEVDAKTVYANNVSGYFDRYEGASNLVAKAIMDTAIEEGYDDAIFSLVNYARADLPSQSFFTLDNIYQSFPFDNMLYVAEVTGREIQKEASYNYICRNPGYTNNDINLNQTYKIVVIDYLYFHSTVEKKYDYFNQTGGTSTVHLANNYRDVLCNWLVAGGYNEGTQLNSENFRSTLWAYNASAFNYSY